MKFGEISRTEETVVYDLSQNIGEAETALTQKPIFATSVERFLILDELKSENPEMAQPMRFAKALSSLLSRVSVPLEPYDYIAGRCVDRELTEEEEGRFQAFLRDPDHPKKKLFLSSGHCAYDWELLVREGLPGLRARAERTLSKQVDAEKRVFSQAMLEIYDAISAYLLRYAEAAKQCGMMGVSENCRIAATEAPTTFASALQLLWTVALIDCAYITENPTLTLGRLDQILIGLYRNDLRAGRLSREKAAVYVTDYYCKHNLIMGRGEHQIGDESNSTTFKRICNFDAPQYLLLGGTDVSGKPVVNELSMLFAECINPKFKNPVVVVRYFPQMNETHPVFWRVLTEKAVQSASLMFYNDDNVKRTFRRMGFTDEECSEYIHFGCNWPSLGTKAAWMLGGPSSRHFDPPMTDEERADAASPYMRTGGKLGWPERFVDALRILSEREEGTVSIDDFYTVFEQQMAEFMDRKLARAVREVERRKRRPAAVMTFGDAFFLDSIENAECFAAGAKYHFELQSFQMFGTVADCFITVDRLCFIEHCLTMRELLAAVDANFEGYEEILALCRKVLKYGSDTPHSNAHAKRLAEMAANLVIEKNRPYLASDGIFLAPCMQSDTWHIKYGEKYTATPDGRLAYTPYSQNSRPSNGACVNGLTAMLNAMLSVPADGCLSGALNLDIDPKQFCGDEGRAMFASMLAVYFNRGGLHAQVSAANVDELKDAQISPERHRDLRVRVTGYSGIFVDLPKRLQNDVIARFS